MARQCWRRLLGGAEHGVFRIPTGEPAGPALYSALLAHGLRQPRRLLADARRTEQAQGARLLLPQSRALGPFPRDQRRDGLRGLGLYGAPALQQPADL